MNKTDKDSSLADKPKNGNGGADEAPNLLPAAEREGAEAAMEAQPSNVPGSLLPAPMPPSAPDAAADEAEGGLLDLNAADAAALQTLPGIGPAMARRIVDFRAAAGSFEKPEDLMKVTGVGEALYRKLVDRVSVQTEPPTAAVAPAAPAPEAEEPEVEEPAAPAPPRPQAKAARASVMDNVLGWLEPQPAPARRAPQRDWTGLMFASFLGAVVGAILTLAVLAGLNDGALVLNEQTEVIALSARADEMSAFLGVLESDAKALRSRLDALEGLTGRMDRVESDLTAVSGALDETASEVAVLSERTDRLAADVEVIRARTERFDLFLNGLRDLLADVQGPAGPQPTATPAPTAAPTEMPRPTATPGG